ncbi:MAG: T9SS type A sorting domain-containing protein [Fibrobacterota bacterium]
MIKVLSLITLTAFSQVPQTDFMIGTWGDPPLTMTDPVADSLTLDSVRNAGFTFLSGAGLVTNPVTGVFDPCTTAYRYALGLLSRMQGLKTLIMDHRIKLDLFDDGIAKSILNYYQSLPDSLRNLMIGYHVGDEPQDTWLPEVRKWVDTFYTYDSLKLPYSGLFPSYVYDETRYRNYVLAFLQNKSAVLGYDDYPFIAGAAMRANYYLTLKILAQSIAPYRAKNFWATVYATEHGFRDGSCNTTLAYAPVTAPLLRYVAHAPLAYGAKGIMYYRYTWRYTAPCDWLFFMDGIRQDPKQYQWVQAQNLKMLHLGPALMRLKWLTAVHGSAVNAYSSEAVPVITVGTPVLKSLGYAQALAGVFSLKDSISGNRYLLLMNKDTGASHSIPVLLKGGWNVEVHSTVSQAWDTVFGAAYIPDSGHTAFSWTLPAAEIALLRLTPLSSCATCPFNLAPIATLSASYNSSAVANVVDGVTDQDFSRWGSDTTVGPHWIALNWDNPVNVESLRLWTGAMWGAGYQIEDFVFQRYDNGQWIDLPGTAVTDNLQDGYSGAFNLFTFGSLTTTGLRLFITDGCVSSLYKNARVFEIEVMGSPDSLTVTKETVRIPDLPLMLMATPNPFNPSTVIRYSLPKGSAGVLSIFNVKGEQVFKTPLTGTPGKIRFDAKGFPSGLYLARLNGVTGTVLTHRLMLLR